MFNAMKMTPHPQEVVEPVTRGQDASKLAARARVLVFSADRVR
jgi:hypothetical protein